MRRILDTLTWVVVAAAVTAAVYFSTSHRGATAGLAGHTHRTEEQRDACRTCSDDARVQIIDEAPPLDQTARAF